MFINLLFGKRHNNHFVGFWYERYELAWVFIGIPNFWWLQRWIAIARMRKTKLTSNFKVITYRNTWRNSFFCSRNVIPKKKREIWGERASQRAVYGGRGTSEPTHNSSRPKTIKYPLFLEEEASGGQPRQPSHIELGAFVFLHNIILSLPQSEIGDRKAAWFWSFKHNKKDLNKCDKESAFK